VLIEGDESPGMLVTSEFDELSQTKSTGTPRSTKVGAEKE